MFSNIRRVISSTQVTKFRIIMLLRFTVTRMMVRKVYRSYNRKIYSSEKPREGWKLSLGEQSGNRCVAGSTPAISFFAIFTSPRIGGDN